MKTFITQKTAPEMASAIKAGLHADYVYMYPPRQAYRSLPQAAMADAVRRSLERAEPINLYIHFPFCRQICAFCNLFAVAGQSDELFTKYMDFIERELHHYSHLLAGKQFNTVYLGGGTPSLLPARLFRRLFCFLKDHLGCRVEAVPEVSLEVSPETVEVEKFAEFREIGINRVNLGVQGATEQELHSIGRRYGSNVALRGLEMAQRLGFRNVCVDLIYGLEGQTLERWKESLNAVLERVPETICVYPLTLRPLTGFASRGYTSLAGHDQYAKYEAARDALLQAGYQQETHIRFIKNSSGGYIQKVNHWALQNVLGVGAGARSYLWHADVRNGYSARNRTAVLRQYFEHVEAFGHARVDGFLIDHDERTRRAVILNLIVLKKPWFHRLFGTDPADLFPMEFRTLSELGLIQLNGDEYRLTGKGLKYRDLAVQLFFSDNVRQKVLTFDYEEPTGVYAKAGSEHRDAFGELSTSPASVS